MLDCLILGDSIAVGTAQFKPECAQLATGGINSWQFNKKYVHTRSRDFEAGVVLISLGSNDHKGIRTYNELYKLREHIKAGKVYWVLPKAETFPDQEHAVNLIAISFGDFVIKPTRYQKDNVHPSWAGYKEIAEQIKE
jgi:lysophospholipase L1-like esterase